MDWMPDAEESTVSDGPLVGLKRLARESYGTDGAFQTDPLWG